MFISPTTYLMLVSRFLIDDDLRCITMLRVI